jgi:DNA polymerase I-like protein with 3'-5' exonuclease and polymerase domains
MLQDWLEENNMKSRIIAEIHDSIILELWHTEIDDVLAKAKHIMTKEIPEIWTYIQVPFEVECEVAPPGGSWYHKEERKVV